jgi:predicted Zn finger-like uncharacterized protein
MIITCNNCDKKFNVDPSIIPENGRVLQCSSCDYKWFFKKKEISDINIQVKVDKPNEDPGLFDDVKPLEIKKSNTNKYNRNKVEDTDKNINSHLKTLKKNKINFNILPSIIVFIISFIALIIILDTFQTPISKIVPSIEFILYNLYETINDIQLFIKDLI